MIRIASFIRKAAFPGMEAVRGPKKKKGEAEVKLQSTDIVNIFKERSDPQILDIEHYPIYVQELSRGAYSFHQFYVGIQHNQPHFMPGRANLKGYFKAWKRQRTKSMGQYRHMDQKPNIMSENDIVSRRALYAIGQLGKEEEAEKRRKQEQAELAAEEEDDDE